MMSFPIKCFGVLSLCAGALGINLALSPLACGGEIEVIDAAGLKAAVAKALPGTIIQLAPGEYGSGFHFEELQGTPGEPIIVEGSDIADPPIFTGGKEAIHLSDCNHLILRNLKVSGCTANGINCDDDGSFDTPSLGIVFDSITIQDIGPNGNFDGLKLSGLKGFTVKNCLFSGWGGSGIDMVGCREGRIESCQFLGKNGFSQATGIQAKGGSEAIQIAGNFFDNAGARGINLGGSTGNQFFRPELRDFEARKIEVVGNRFIGGQTAIAFVTSVDCVVRQNTIIHPRKWIFRILQERPLDEFQACRNGVFEKNLIVYDRRVNTFVNVGSRTKPETFAIRENAWFCSDGDRRPSLPVDEIDGIYQIDPMLEDSAAAGIETGSTNPLLRPVGARAYFVELP